MDGVLGQGGQHRFDINPGWGHQGLPKRLPIELLRQVAGAAFDHFAHQRKAIRVNAGRRQAQHHIALRHQSAGENFGLFHHAHGKTGQVVFARGIHTRHFCGFAAHQGATGLFATGGDALNHGGSGIDVEFSAGKVIQKEKWLCPLNQNIIDAHGHQIDAHAVVHAPIESQLEFGTHTIGAADQYRLLVTLGHLKQGAKATQARQNPFSQGFGGHGLDAFNQSVTGINVHAGIFVGKGFVHVGRLG